MRPNTLAEAVEDIQAGSPRDDRDVGSGGRDAAPRLRLSLEEHRAAAGPEEPLEALVADLGDIGTLRTRLLCLGGECGDRDRERQQRKDPGADAHVLASERGQGLAVLRSGL